MNGHDARRQLEMERRRLEAARHLLLEQHGRAPSTATYHQHPADAATDTYEQEVETSVLHAVERELMDIATAEARIADGTYGRCETCGLPIGEARLHAIPWATRCLADQEAAEVIDLSAEELAMHGDRT